MTNISDLTQLRNRLNNILREYEKKVDLDVEDVLKEVTRNSALRLRKNSSGNFQSRSGNLSYRRGWRAKKATSGRYEHKWVIYNATKYQLTHLLEKGHANRNKSKPRVSAFPHIAQEEKNAINEVINELTRKLGGS